MTAQISKSEQDERGLLPYPVIIAATKGDPEAMNIVVQHYESYIASLSMRKLRDERGNIYWGIDEDIRDRLRSRLMRAVLQLANKQQTADCRRNVDRPQSPVGALRSCGFVQVSDQHDSAPGSLCNVSQTAEYRAHLVCSVHVHICTQKSLYRVNDNQPCVVFPDCPCDAFIGKGQRCVSIVNDKHFFKVCVRFHQPGLDRIAQTILGGLIDDIERLKCLHSRCIRRNTRYTIAPRLGRRQKQ